MGWGGGGGGGGDQGAVPPPPPPPPPPPDDSLNIHECMLRTPYCFAVSYTARLHVPSAAHRTDIKAELYRWPSSYILLLKVQIQLIQLTYIACEKPGIVHSLVLQVLKYCCN